LAVTSGKANVDQAVKVNSWCDVEQALNVSSTIHNHLYPWYQFSFHSNATAH
jgi:hypothetical protein